MAALEQRQQAPPHHLQEAFEQPPQGPEIDAPPEPLQSYEVDFASGVDFAAPLDLRRERWLKSGGGATAACSTSVTWPPLF
eukprot:7410114-Pyramimonas_sp.AAC.1